jgi:hypothetical protein
MPVWDIADLTDARRIMQKTLFMALAAAALTLGFVASAEAQVCWTHNVAEGQGFATPLAACQHAGGHHVVLGANGNYSCRDVNDNVVTVVYGQDPEPMCYGHVNGPYQGLSIGGTQSMGRDYTSPQRDAIIVSNENCFGGNIKSDLHGAKQILLDWIGVYDECDELVDGPGTRASPCAADVHHSIPKKDTKGCPCGSNSAMNALVVGARINRLMSNLPPPPALITYINNLPTNICPP